jgi:hypothetical protein
MGGHFINGGTTTEQIALPQSTLKPRPPKLFLVDAVFIGVNLSAVLVNVTQILIGIRFAFSMDAIALSNINRIHSERPKAKLTCNAIASQIRQPLRGCWQS